MKNKKILFTVLVLLCVLCGATSSSALFLDFLDDLTKDPDVKVTVDEFNFTLPAGSSEVNSENRTEDGIEIINKVYVDDYGYPIDIAVAYNPKDPSNFLIDSDSRKPITIGDVKGRYSADDDLFDFIYRENNKYVSIVAHNESIVYKMLTGSYPKNENE